MNPLASQVVVLPIEPQKKSSGTARKLKMKFIEVAQSIMEIMNSIL
jgi:hypothetical protein